MNTRFSATNVSSSLVLRAVPGCVATGATVEETGRAMREAIAFHLDGLREDGAPIPPPSSRVDYVEVAF